LAVTVFRLAASAASQRASPPATDQSVPFLTGAYEKAVRCRKDSYGRASPTIVPGKVCPNDGHGLNSHIRVEVFPAVALTIGHWAHPSAQIDGYRRRLTAFSGTQNCKISP
jgi:hypothetical protein